MDNMVNHATASEAVTLRSPMLCTIPEQKGSNVTYIQVQNAKDNTDPY